MRPVPPLPTPGESSRRPTTTRRIWEDEAHGAYDAYDTYDVRDTRDTRAMPYAYSADDQPTRSLRATRPLNWPDDYGFPLGEPTYTSPYSASRPLGLRAPHSYPIPGQEIVDGRRLLMIGGIALGILLIASTLALALGLLPFTPSTSGDVPASGPPIALTPPPATLAPTLTSTPLPAIAASYVTQDTSTQGNWQSLYGSQGYSVANDTQQFPSAVQVTLTGQQIQVWTDPTTDPRALRKATDPSNGIASAWSSTSSFTIDVNVTDGQTYQLALYFLDWDQQHHAEIVNAIDPTSYTVLDSRSITNFSNGVYLLWNVRGHTTFQISSAPGAAGAVVSGIFLSPASAPGTLAPAEPAPSTPSTPSTPQGTPSPTPAFQPTETPTALP